VALEIPAARRRGVIARNTGAAIKGRDALKVCGMTAQRQIRIGRLPAELEEASRKPGLVVRKDATPDAALRAPTR